MEFPEEFKQQISDLETITAQLEAENRQFKEIYPDEKIEMILSANSETRAIQKSSGGATNKIKNIFTTYKYYILAGAFVLIVSITGFIIYKRKK